jgi:hypothetical protein
MWCDHATGGHSVLVAVIPRHVQWATNMAGARKCAAGRILALFNLRILNFVP